MNDLLLDNSHDIIIENGDLLLVNKEAQMAAQAVKINLLTIRGEWWENLSLGIPYLQSILRKGAAKEFVDTIMKQAIEDSYNISRVVEFNSSINEDRRYVINRARALTTSGEIVSITNQII